MARLDAILQKYGSGDALQDILAPAPAQATPPVSPKKPLQEFAPLVEAASEKYGVPKDVIYGMIMTESKGNPKAVSPAGARGLMQLMPGTAKELGVSDPFDPAQSIDAGTRYVRKNYDMFNDPVKAVTAYNTGPGNVRRYNGPSPNRESREYAPKVFENAKLFAEEAKVAPRAAGPTQPSGRLGFFLARGKQEANQANNTPQGIKFKGNTTLEGLTPDARSLVESLPQQTGVSPTITSGYRDPKENSSVGGVPTSRHMSGNAFDIRIKDLQPEQQQKVISFLNSQKGVKSFIHNGNHIHTELDGSYKTQGTVEPKKEAPPVTQAQESVKPTRMQLLEQKYAQGEPAAQPKTIQTQITVQKAPPVQNVWQTLTGAKDAMEAPLPLKGVTNDIAGSTAKQAMDELQAGAQPAPAAPKSGTEQIVSRLGLDPQKSVLQPGNKLLSNIPDEIKKWLRVPIDLGPGMVESMVDTGKKLSPLAPENVKALGEDPLGGVAQIGKNYKDALEQLILDPMKRIGEKGGEAVRGRSLAPFTDNPSESIGDIMTVLGIAKGIKGIGKGKVPGPEKIAPEAGTGLEGALDKKMQGWADAIDAKNAKKNPNILKGKDLERGNVRGQADFEKTQVQKVPEERTIIEPLEEKTVLEPQPKVVKGSLEDLLDIRIKELEGEGSPNVLKAKDIKDKFVKSAKEDFEVTKAESVRKTDTIPDKKLGPEEVTVQDPTLVKRGPKPEAFDDATGVRPFEPDAVTEMPTTQKKPSSIPHDVDSLMKEGFSRKEALEIIKEQQKPGGMLGPQEKAPEVKLTDGPGFEELSKLPPEEPHAPGPERLSPDAEAQSLGFKDANDFAKQHGFRDINHLSEELGISQKKSRGGGVVLGSGLGGIQEMLPEMPKSRIGEYYAEEAPKFTQIGEKDLKTGMTVGKYAIDEGLKKKLSESKDVSGATASGYSLKDARRVAEKVEGRPNGPISQGIVDKAIQVEDKTNRKLKELAGKIKWMAKDQKLMQRYGEYKTAPEGAKSRLSPRELRKIESNPKLKARMDKGVEVARKLYDQFHAQLVKAGLDIPYRKDFFAQLNEMGAEQKSMGEVSGFVHSNEPAFKHVKHRKGWESKTTGVYDGLLAYGRSAMRHVYGAPEVPKMRAIIEALPENAKKYFTDYVDQVVVGQINPTEAAFERAAPRTRATANFLQRQFSRNAILGKVSVAAQQPAAIAQTVGSAGLKNTIAGAVKAVLPSTSKKWLAQSPEYFSRRMNLEYRPGVLGTAKKFASFLMETLDNYDVETSLEAHYRKGIAEKMTPQQAIKYANNMTQQTHNSVMRSAKPAVLRNPVGRLTMPLQSFTINLFNYLRQDLPQMAKYERTPGAGAMKNFASSNRATGTLIRFAVAAYAVNQLYDKAGLNKPYDATSAIPMMGSVKYGSIGIPGKMYDIIMGGAKALSSDNPQEQKAGLYKFLNASRSFIINNQLWQTAQGARTMFLDKGVVKGNDGKKKFKIEGPADTARALAFGPNGTKAGKEYYNERDQKFDISIPERVEKIKQGVSNFVAPGSSPTKKSRRKKAKKKVSKPAKNDKMSLEKILGVDDDS